MHRKGRSFDNRGEKNPKAKLTETDVRSILELYAAGQMGYRRLARKFGVGNTTIRAILEGRSWRSVEMAPAVK